MIFTPPFFYQGVFYSEICEEEVNNQGLLYHCDHSFHYSCPRQTNIKYKKISCFDISNQRHIFALVNKQESRVLLWQLDLQGSMLFFRLFYGMWWLWIFCVLGLCNRNLRLVTSQDLSKLYLSFYCTHMPLYNCVLLSYLTVLKYQSMFLSLYFFVLFLHYYMYC